MKYVPKIHNEMSAQIEFFVSELKTCHKLTTHVTTYGECGPRWRMRQYQETAYASLNKNCTCPNIPNMDDAKSRAQNIFSRIRQRASLDIDPFEPSSTANIVFSEVNREQVGLVNILVAITVSHALGHCN